MADLTLREFQQWMKSRIRPGEAVSVAEEGPLNPQRGTPGPRRMAVYAAGYVARMREALAEVFEAVEHVLGDGAFLQLTQAYAARHPSHDYNLSFAGRHLPEFLAEWPRTTELPFLPDLARLEWLVCRAFHAFDRPPMDAGALAAMPPKAWEGAQFTFQPSLGLLASAWPVLDIWQVRQQPRDTIKISLVDRPQRVLVCRRGVQVMCELIDAPQHQLLEALRQGRTLGDVCAAVTEHAGDPPPVADWFAHWSRCGLITGYRTLASPQGVC